MVPWARLELALLKGKDFKSFVSTNFTTRAPRFRIVISVFIYNSSYQTTASFVLCGQCVTLIDRGVPNESQISFVFKRSYTFII